MSQHVLLAGASIHACKHSGHHLVMYEENSTLLNAILSPLLDLVLNHIKGASKPQIVNVDSDKEHVKMVLRIID